MRTWPQVYADIEAAIDQLGGDHLLFRGHANSSWPLLPGLGRWFRDNTRAKGRVEQRTYFDFVTRAGDLLPPSTDSWNVLFLMQHYGLPTRLLDWTETLGVALYFAVKESAFNASIWILNPIELNRRTLDRPHLIHPTDLHGTYDEYYVARTKKMKGDVIALSPLRHNPRVSHQRAGFTLHDDLTQPLNRLHPEVVREVPIPLGVRLGAANFLKLAGISEFALFPDLDGLARELRLEHFAPSDDSGG